MIEYVKSILTSQYEAALCMLKECVEACPVEHWDGIIGKYPFWQVAYHALCFADLYLTPNENAYQFRDIHPKGWDEFNEEYPSRRFEKLEITSYAAICRAKAVECVAAETAESLQGPSGHARRTFSRGELHLVNLRHIQHHTGQLNSFLRRMDPAFQSLTALRWAAAGWRD